MPEHEVQVVRHATWCNVEWDAGPCDCGGNGGRCPRCGREGPCGWVPIGGYLVPAICALDEAPVSLDSGDET